MAGTKHQHNIDDDAPRGTDFGSKRGSATGAVGHSSGPGVRRRRGRFADSQTNGDQLRRNGQQGGGGGGPTGDPNLLAASRSAQDHRQQQRGTASDRVGIVVGMRHGSATSSTRNGFAIDREGQNLALSVSDRTGWIFSDGRANRSVWDVRHG